MISMNKPGLLGAWLGLLVLSAASARAEPDTAKLNRYFQALTGNDRMMLSVAVARGDELIYQYQGGFASVEAARPLTPATLMRAGSITKVFTAVLVLQLAEEGKLGLDDRLERYMPVIPNAADITLRQMLGHRSGIGSYTDQPDYPDYMTATQSRERMIERIASVAPAFAPGAGFGYSNSNYFLLGAIVEDVTGQALASVVSDRITGPLELAFTHLGDAVAGKDREAASYVRQGVQWQKSLVTDMSIPGGAGALVTTPSDLVRFLRGLFTGRLIGAESLAQMQALQDNYGLGLIAFPFYERQFLGHNGGIDGFVSSAAYNEDDGVSIAVISNGQNYNFNDVLIALLSGVYGMDFEVPDFTAAPVQIDGERLAALTGRYVSEQLPLEIRVFEQAGQLMAQATGQGAFPLTPYSDVEFRFEQAGIVMVFDRQAESIAFTLHQGGGQFVYRRMGD